ncbi:MAG: hypothetical protein KGI37_09990 [Alphaproteobacteria bacterium]|nr:hypothetical protein [Alphaproteobacteria bacterium]
MTYRRGIGAGTSEINSVSTIVAAAVQEQIAAIDEISQNVQQAAQRTEELSHSISSVTDAAQKTGNVAVTVLQKSEQLSGEAEKLRAEVSKFLDALK